VSLVRENDLIGHTFTRKDQRPYRIVIKTLHLSTLVTEISSAIESTGNKIRGEIINVKFGPDRRPTSTFFVNLEPSDKNKAVKDLTHIYHTKITIVDPFKKPGIVQCQQYGHSKNYCMRPYRCVKCAQGHNTAECPKKDNSTPAKCALCSGNHPANYKGCKVYLEIYNRKILHPQEPKTRPSYNPTKTPLILNNREENQNQIQPNAENPQNIRSYSDVASNRPNNTEPNNSLESLLKKTSREN